MAAYRRWHRGTRLTVVTYEGGEPHEHRAFIGNNVLDRRRRIEILPRGKAYLASLKKEATVA